MCCVCVYHRRYSNAALTTVRACHSPSRLGARDRDFLLLRRLLLCSSFFFNFFFPELEISDTQRREERERETHRNKFSRGNRKVIRLVRIPPSSRGHTNKTFSGSILLATPFLYTFSLTERWDLVATFFSSSFLSHLNVRHFGNKLQKEIKKRGEITGQRDKKYKIIETAGELLFCLFFSLRPSLFFFFISLSSFLLHSLYFFFAGPH